MIIVEIVLIIIGLLAVLISFKLGDNKKEDDNDALLEKPVPDFNESQLQKVEKPVPKFDESKLQKKIDEMLDKADEQLGKLLNEKIMGFSEYSGQIFDKMQKNHGEEVFLYNMLNEKKKEIEELMHNADASKAFLREKVINDYKEVEKPENIDKLSSHDAGIGKIEIEKNKEFQSMENEVDDAFDNLSATSKPMDTGSNDENNKKDSNYNKEIINLYKKGHSVLEISKILSIGQGEVKFVIDLHDAR